NKKSQKRLKIFSVTAAVLALLFIAGIILILHSLFPKAKPVDFPEDFERLTVIPYGSDTEQTVYPEDAALLLDVLRDAKPTRRQSVQDFPVEREYTTFTIHVSDASPSYHRFYLYEDGGDMILEIPYGGIYIVRDPEHRIFGREMPVTDPEKE
ncbi:MAG: DUF5301 domain-containing protein, partial [Clostridia bacterium]|nr:DUF5301 domain-containing protein [Clostridia bacterium]